MYYSVKDPYSDELIFGIQIERNTSGNLFADKFCGFTNADEEHIIILLKIIGLKMSELFTKSENSIKDIKFREVLNIFRKSLCQRTIQALTNTLKKELAQFSGFESVGIFIYNEKGSF